MSSDPTELRKQITKLESKIGALRDPEIREVLEEKLAELRTKLSTLEPQQVDEPKEAPAEVDEEFLIPAPPTPQQAAQAEDLLRRSHVEKIRGNRQQAEQLLLQAREVAPGSPAVLESIADGYMERKQFKLAREVLSQALKIDPTNPSIERKYAQCVLQTSSTLSIEDQLRLGASDVPFWKSNEAYTDPTKAFVFNLLLPGLGHIVSGKRSMGIGLIGAWLAGIGGLVLFREDLRETFRALAGIPNKATFIALLPILGLAVVYIISLTDSKRGQQRRVVHRPDPPVNLPFE